MAKKKEDTFLTVAVAFSKLDSQIMAIRKHSLEAVNLAKTYDNITSIMVNDQVREKSDGYSNMLTINLPDDKRSAFPMSKDAAKHVLAAFQEHLRLEIEAAQERARDGLRALVKEIDNGN